MTRFWLSPNCRSGLHRSRGLANIPLNLFFVRSLWSRGRTDIGNKVTVAYVPPLLIPAVDDRLADCRDLLSARCRSHADPVAAHRLPHRVDSGRTRAYMN